MVTSLLLEKLHSKELQVEQLHAELAAAVRGNEIFKSEVQIFKSEVQTTLDVLELQVCHQFSVLYLEYE